MSDICIVCDSTIRTMCFRGTGVCSDNCRKKRPVDLTEGGLADDPSK